MNLHTTNAMIRTRSNFAEEAHSINVRMILDVANGISVVHPMADLCVCDFSYL
jgi:hypothetical protein